MKKYILGGIALAVTGYGIKKFLEDEENAQKVQEMFEKGYDWLDEFQDKAENFFDDVDSKTDDFFYEEEAKKEEEHYEEINKFKLIK